MKTIAGLFNSSGHPEYDILKAIEIPDGSFAALPKNKKIWFTILKDNGKMRFDNKTFDAINAGASESVPYQKLLMIFTDVKFCKLDQPYSKLGLAEMTNRVTNYKRR